MKLTAGKNKCLVGFTIMNHLHLAVDGFTFLLGTLKVNCIQLDKENWKNWNKK
jgi:hypothetical protein